MRRQFGPMVVYGAGLDIVGKVLILLRQILKLPDDLWLAMRVLC